MTLELLSLLWRKIQALLGLEPGLYGLMGRSGKWPAVRRAFLLDHPECAGCGSTKDPEVHHEWPYWLKPELELDPANLIHLCGPRANGCHWRLGHNCRSWTDWNEHVREDAANEHRRLSIRCH